ncbi:MAG: amidohydrolase family protein [Ilumatobacteraceae bacterium]
MSSTTPGLVCAHHHLYSSLARGMPAPPSTPTNFLEILRNIWWRLDVALDEDTIHWSATLGAVEALMSGTTGIIDHHESPNFIDGSLDVISRACDAVGVRVNCSYGITERHGTESALRGLRENERHIRAGGRGMVGVHAAFTCSDDLLHRAAELAADLGVGVHIHVAEGIDDVDAGRRLEGLARDDWFLVHCVHLDRDLAGTVVHNPRSNMNNSVGYAKPTTRTNKVALGTDGIGSDMLEEARLAYVALRAHDVTATPETVWEWLQAGYEYLPECRSDVVEWNYDHADSPWHVAFSPGIRAINVTSSDGEKLLVDGRPTRVDLDEVRAKAGEAAQRLFARL